MTIATRSLAAAELASRDRAVPALDVLIDPEALADVLGESVSVDRVRYKPGNSVVAAVTVAGERRWVASYAVPVKRAKTIERAAQLGYAVSDLPGHPGILTGHAYADRELHHAIRALRRKRAALLADAEILRHNPHRRLVLRSGDFLVKVASHDAGSVAMPAALAWQGVPVVTSSRVARGVTTTPWWGAGDLANSPKAESAASTGRALAVLHSASLPATPMLDARGALSGAVDAVVTLLPAEGGRARALAHRIRLDGGAPVVSHGDFSPDQVLVGAEQEVRLIDFDRACLASPERDLGSFAAVAPTPVTEGLLTAYREAGGAVDGGSLAHWTAYALLLGAVEPFRRVDPDWPAALTRALDRAEALL